MASCVDFDALPCTLETTATVVMYWSWSRDARCVSALMELPVHPSHADEVLSMCIDPNLDPGRICLLLRYSRFLRGARPRLRERVADMCILATRFLPSHAFCALDIMDQTMLPEKCLATYLACIGNQYGMATRCRGARLARQVESSDTYVITRNFDALVALAPHCDDALGLLDKVAGEFTLGRALQVTKSLMLGSATHKGVLMLVDIARRWPAEAVDCGVLVPILARGMTLGASVVRLAVSSAPVLNEHRLLVYMFKYGCPPASQPHLLSNVLKHFSVAARVVYADHFDAYAEARVDLPEPLGPLDEAHSGCIDFVCQAGTDVRMLLAPLVRHCGYFRPDKARLRMNLTGEYTEEQLKLFRHLVYYDRMAKMTDADLCRVTALADMLCDTRHVCMCVAMLVRVDFWMAYDLAKDFRGATPWLQHGARDQLKQLVKCSRIAEIADLVAGTSGH